MTALNTAEAGIPEEVLAGWRSEYGHEIEEKFEDVLVDKLGVESLKEEPSQEKADEMAAKGQIAVMRASAKEDFEEGIDFKFFNPLTGKMVPVDVSVSKDPVVHAEKRNREIETGVRFLPLSARTVDLAARGSERDLQDIWRSVNRLLLSDALDQARSGEVRIPEAKLAGIERRLAELQYRT